MNLFKRSNLLQLLALGLGLAGVTIVALALLLPYDPQVSADPAAAPVSDPGASAPAPAAPARVTLAQLQQISSLPLRRALFPQPGEEPIVTAGAALPLTVKLIAAAHEPGFSMAIFQKPDGTVEACPVGETIDDPAGAVQVTRIDAKTVTVKFRGQLQSLALPLPDDAGVPGAAVAAGAPGRPAVRNQSPLSPEARQQRIAELKAAAAARAAARKAAAPPPAAPPAKEPRP